MRSVRTSLVALMLAVAALASAPTLQAAPVDSLPDTTGILTPWRLEPARPCVHDSVFMIVRGFVATPCDSFLGAEAISPLFVRIRRQVNVDRACFTGPTTFYPVPVALGRFAAGAHAGIVELVTTEVRNDRTTTRLAQQFRFDFVVDSLCEIPPPGPGPLPFVHSIGTEPPRPCAGRPTSLVIKGAFNDGCGCVIGATVHDPRNVELTLSPKGLPGPACPLVITPWRQDFDLGSLPSGPHRTNITLHVVRVDSAGSIFRRDTYYGSHEFFVEMPSVYNDCDSIPPPAPGPLPYVGRIAIGRDDTCGPLPPCPGDSILVRFDGVFPSDCFRFRGIELIPRIETIVPPPPPIVRVIVDDGCCLGRPCFSSPTPWSAAVKLPPMVAGDHRLDVELAQVCCSDSYPPGELHRASVPFAIADSCPVPPPCLTVDFAPGPGDFSACNATVATGRPAELTFLVRPTVALAGLQGEFRLYPTALKVTRIEPIGPAEGMLIDWTPTEEGARFVLFAPSGAPIPTFPKNSRMVETGGWPVLRVTVEHVARGGPPPERTVVTSENLLGSDIAGGAVRLCPPPPCVDFDPRFSWGRALICGERACDFNADGLQDVRDLVLMVHCVNGEGICPPDAATRFDCDADSTLTIADVLCCARNVLRRPPCPECPPDTGQVRPEPGVAVSFDTPEVTHAGIAIDMRINHGSRLGAALLTLEAPLDRYEVVGFDASPPGNWLTLHEVRDGRIVLGLINPLGPNSLALQVDPRFTLTLALRPGQPAGGAVTAVGGEFSGPDGVTLGVDLGRPSQTLPGAAQLALSPNQPNPFSTETAFTLRLAERADVVVGIYDLRGRAVANLHRAPLPPGPHVFRWDGRRADGSAAANGVYFYQATVGGRSLARKLILMRAD